MLYNNLSTSVDERNSVLLNKNLYKLVLANIAGRLCNKILTIIDSILGSRFIGPEGMAAVSIFSPIDLMDNALHAILAAGLVILYSRYCGRNDKRKANWTYSAVLVTTFISYIVLSGLLLVFSKSFVSFYMETDTSYRLAMDYYIPMVIALPFFEASLLTERAFMTDGRPFFFSLRCVVSIILNVILDYLFLARFSMGTRGLALATIISTMAGYMLTFSHAFSKKNTVRLSFDIFRKPQEYAEIMREELHIGSGYALNRILAVLFSLFFNKYVLLIGGSVALFAVSLFSSIRSIAQALADSASAPITIIASSLYGEEDYEGMHIVVKSTFRTAAIIGLFCTAVSAVFSALYIDLCHVADAYTYSLCLSAVRISSVGFAGIISGQVFKDLLNVCRNYKFCRFYCVLNYVMHIALLFTLRPFGVTSLWIAYALYDYLTIFSVFLAIKITGNSLYPKISDNVIVSLSTVLNNNTISMLSEKAIEILEKNNYPESFAKRMGLIIEESCYYIFRKNKSNTTIHLDMRIISTAQKLHISICDDGTACDPSTEFRKNKAADNADIGLLLINKISDNYSYNRIADLNYSRLDCSVKKISVFTK